MHYLKEWIVTHQNMFKGLFATIAILMGLMVLADWLIMPLYTQHGRERELPDVTEMSMAEARSLLIDNGFDIVVEKSVYDATYPESTVVQQNPAAYSRVKNGRRVYVTLSAGEKLVQIPHVIGKSERDAEFTLKQSGLLLGDVYYEYHDYHLRGVVSDQSIHASLEVTENTSIDITVSLGREPHRFLVPDVVGKSLEDARKIILKSGLEIGSISFVVKREYVPDTVIEQSLKSGSEVNQGSAIDLVVSRLESMLWQ